MFMPVTTLVSVVAILLGASVLGWIFGKVGPEAVTGLHHVPKTVVGDHGLPLSHDSTGHRGPVRAMDLREHRWPVGRRRCGSGGHDLDGRR